MHPIDKNYIININIDVVNDVFKFEFMNIQQFQYVLSVVDSRNFEDAADRCFVTQSTLSTMINKLEAEIGIKIFNRKTKPVTVTQEGQKIIDRLRIITSEVDALENVVQEIKGEMAGNLKIGVIPTIAPYLLPLFVNEFAEQFPKVNIIIREMTTRQIQNGLLVRELDMGILALPLEHKELTETPLYKEPFLVYDCTESNKRGRISPLEIDYSKVCLLEEGHCLRTQVYDICALSEKNKDSQVNLKFESGSMESLVRVTESRRGITILPYLASKVLDAKAQQNLRGFKTPVPVRSIGLITHNFFVKEVLKEALSRIIQKEVEGIVPETDGDKIVKPI